MRMLTIAKSVDMDFSSEMTAASVTVRESMIDLCLLKSDAIVID